MSTDLEAPEIKAAIAEAVKSAVEEATTGLKTKNTELLAKLKIATKNAEITPEEHNRVIAENEKLQEQINEANKQLKLGVSEFDKLKKQFEMETKFNSTLLVDNGLTDAIVKAGVKPELSKAVKAMMAGQVTIKIDGESRSAMIGDKLVSDFVSDWAKSDEGKHFVAAPANAGGGANGGANNPPAQTLTSLGKIQAGLRELSK